MRITLSFVISAFVALGTTSVFAAEDKKTEEMIVTGSYLKRSAENSPSPLSVITAADIEDLGAADVAEIVQAMPWQSGSQTRATTFSGEGADGRNSVNLRNLGHGATLPLLNGKRQVPSWYNPRGEASVNINGLVPNIALERIEIVKDGASALYGSDAIAGVVNFITKKDFEGLDFDYQFTTDEETREGAANEASLLFGIQGDRGGVVVAASFLNRDEITIGDRYDRFGGSSASSTGQPGRIIPLAGQQIRWAAHGLMPGQLVTGGFPRDAMGLSRGQADVDCERAAIADGEGGTLNPVLGNNVCPYDFGSFFALQADESLRKFHVTGHYDITDRVQAYMEFSANDAEFDRKNSLNPNALNLPIPVTNLGNVEDAFRRGIEPIQVINNTRLIGGTATSSRQDRPLETLTDINRSDQRMILGALWDVDIAGREWNIDASYTATEHDSATTQVQDTLSSHMQLALSGLGGPNCNFVNGTPGEGNAAYAASGGQFTAGRCYFFNPFGNHRFARDGSRQTNLALVNAPELYQWLLGRITADEQFRERVIDVVASGAIADLPAGPLGLAVGFQRRRDTADTILDAAANSNNLDFAFGAQDWRGSLTTVAAFAELGIPILQDLELNIAGRYEDFDELDVDTFDPKATLLFRPIEGLSFRGSIGTSFRTPSLLQSGGSLTTVANQVDFSGDSAFRPSITTGNPALQPEEATNYNLGLSWVPVDGVFEGLQIDLDYYDYQYKDIITRESSSTILANDNAALRAYIAANAGSTVIDAINAGAGNRAQVIRSGQGQLLRILPNFANANSADISGLDVTTSYSFEQFGNWRVGLQAAFVLSYDVEVPLPAGGVQKFDAVGQYNDRNPVARPLPEYKINGTVSYSNGNHRGFLLIKYIPEVDYGFDLATDPGSGAARFWQATVTTALGAGAARKFFTRDIESNTTADLQYSYSFGEALYMSDSSVSVGVQNLTNEEPPWVPVNTGYDATLHDPRGRVWFLRLGGSL